ncbi:MAG: hypothetical protein OEY80_11535, partial [Nitrospirota bacterium]|nr:hypothetical protein [Nitrospirota bacterium]
LKHRIYENGKWSDPLTIPKQKSKKGVGLAVLGNRLHMVHLGNKSNQLWYSTYDGNSWTPNVKILNQKSKKRPVLATFQNRVHMVHLGDSSNDLWHSMYIPGQGWTVNVRIPGQKSKNTPGLALFRNQLHMVHSGDSSNDLWHSVLVRDQWTKNQKLPIDSKYSPTLAFSANNSTPWMELVHFEKGGSALYHSLYGRHLRRGRTWIEWFDTRPLASLQSDSSVGMAFFEGCWHMVSVKNKKLMHTTFATSEIHPNVR